MQRLSNTLFFSFVFVSCGLSAVNKGRNKVRITLIDRYNLTYQQQQKEQERARVRIDNQLKK